MASSSVATAADARHALVIEGGEPVVCAGFVSRLIAGAIDIIVIAAVLTGANWFLTTAEELMRPWSQTDLSAALVAAAPVIVVAYFVVLWRLTGQTVGKRLLGLRVVAIDGGRITVGRAIVRVAGYVVSAVPLYAGYLQILFDPQRRALHDRLSRTAVIYDLEDVKSPARRHVEPRA
jgi:uncharacterized RDD family membrane protein YckC